MAVSALFVARFPVFASDFHLRQSYVVTNRRGKHATGLTAVQPWP